MTSPTACPHRPRLRIIPADRSLRLLTVITLINSLGTGLFLTTSTLFLTSSAGLTPTQLGLGLGVAGAFGIAAGPPMGWLADRWGTKQTLALLWAADGAAMLGYLFIHSFAAFLPLVCTVTFLDRGASGVRGALTVHALPPAERIHGRAYLRAVINVGMGLGAALAALALQTNTRGAYLSVIVADAVTFGIAAGLLMRLHPAGLPASRARPSVADPPRRRALTDGPYLLLTALYGVLSLQFGILQVGIPLWVVRFTSAPRWIISASLVVNTIMVALLQVRASRGTNEPLIAARICGRSGALLAAGCIVYGLAHGLSPLPGAAILLAGTALVTLGEVLSAAGAWALSYELADPAAHGAYQGLFNSGFSAGMLLSAPVLTSSVIRFGLLGWVALAVTFGAAGALFIPLTRRMAASGARQTSDVRSR